MISIALLAAILAVNESPLERSGKGIGNSINPCLETKPES